MKEPIFMEPVFKDYIWGGTRLKEKLHKNTPYEKTAESWEISTNENGKTKILNGEYSGKTLYDLFESKEKREEIFGTKTINLEKFPLLVKLIDAESNLSVQVHPDDKYALERENDTGKTEMWYIIDCKIGTQLICGTKESITQENIKLLIQENRIEEALNYISIHPGDVIYIPSGTIHAILGGTLLFEIQQNSDLTYRVYDWGRVGKDGRPRQLHTEKAIDVIDVNKKIKCVPTGTDVGEENIVNGEFFKTNKIVIENKYKDEVDEKSFYIISIVKGVGKIIVGETEYEIKLGDNFILPANMGAYELNGKLEVLKTYL